MIKDAATRFPASITSSALSLKPTSNNTGSPALGSLQIGQLNLNNRTPSQVEAGVSSAARGIFNKVRQGVEML